MRNITVQEASPSFFILKKMMNMFPSPTVAILNVHAPVTYIIKNEEKLIFVEFLFFCFFEELASLYMEPLNFNRKVSFALNYIEIYN
jgi:hypothetical protein